MKALFSRGFRSGQALVELALSISVILLTMVGVMEISKLIAAQQRLASTTREGGRLYVRHGLDGSSQSDIYTKVIDPMMDSMVQAGETSADYTIIISSLIREDPNNDTADYDAAADVDDDKIVIETQYKYVGGTYVSGSTTYTSKHGVVNSSVAVYGGGSSNLLDLDFLKVDERAALVEIFRTSQGMTSLVNVIPGLDDIVLYEQGVY